MPLRDHFRPPLDDAHSWEELHGQWPAVIVQHLRKKLPPGYEAAPRLHSGSQVEIDVAAYEKDEPPPRQPSVAIETILPDYDEYEVRIYDAKRHRQLVAAIEIVSPANKDRPEHRSIFVAKCAALVRKGIAVSIVDLVTVRRFNLYADLLTLIGHSDPTLGAEPPSLCAASCRWVRKGTRAVLEAWSNALAIGQALPTLPLWLSSDLVVPLNLGPSYEQACSDLWIE
jgi:hypothetical protein